MQLGQPHVIGMRRIALGPELGDRETGGSRQNLRLFLGGPCREALLAVRGGEKVRNIEVRPASPGCSFTLGDSSIVFAKQQMRLTSALSVRNAFHGSPLKPPDARSQLAYFDLRRIWSSNIPNAIVP